MKTQVILFLILLFTIGTKAQPWIVPGTGNIYYNGGNVGIGTSTPTNKLQIGTSPSSWIGNDLVVSNSAANQALAISSDAIRSYVFSSGRLDLYGNNTCAMSLSSGNVGIGTTSPGAILHIGGSQISQYSSMIIDNTQTNLVGGCIRSGLLIRANTTNAGNNIDMVDGLIIASPTLTSGGGTFQNLRGITIHEQTGASRNTDLLIGTTGNYLTPGGDFAIYSASFRNSYFAGNVGIGTTTPGNKLEVNGTIRAKEVKVESGWADYVFDKGYNLQDLSEVELYINKHKHLPDVPDANEVEKNGVNLGEMNALLLKKIEELTLYSIEQNKKAEEQNKRSVEQAKKIETLEKAVNNLISN